MAIWKSENSLLTQMGVEILNKVKAGVGSITVTRVVAGSGRVSSSQLFQQTALSGTTKPMVITSREVVSSGSEISTYITNQDFTEPFNINQIGVFVTHPDYAGEVLYHISQCEAEGYDVIPPLDETPANFGYNLFLEHGNSSSISLTVDPQGAVSIERFSNFTEKIVPHHLVSADINGNLQDAGKAVEELFNPNLLVNTYFPNPVNRQDGYVVPGNTPYYSDDSLTSQVGILTGHTRVNKLDDTVGSVNVNNVAYFVPWSAAVKGYANHSNAIDRWAISDTNIYMLLEDDGIVFGNDGTETKYLHNNTYINPNFAIGNKFTLSLLLADGRLLSATSPVYTGGQNWSFARIDLPEFSAYLVANGSNNFFGVQFAVYAGKSLKLVAIKVETGTQQSLAHKDDNGNWVLNEVPNYYFELAKCAQYNGVFEAHESAISPIDLDYFKSLGCKRVFKSLHKPSSTSDYGLVWNISGSDKGYIVQYYLDATTRAVYRRAFIDTVWTSWQIESATTLVPATIE